MGRCTEMVDANRCWGLDVAAGGSWRQLAAPARIVIGPRRPPSCWPPNRARVTLGDGPSTESFTGWFGLVAGVGVTCALSGSRLLALGVDIEAERTSEGLGAPPLRAWSVLEAIGTAAAAGEFDDDTALKRLMGMAAGGPAIGPGGSPSAELRLIATHQSLGEVVAANSLLQEDLLAQFLCDPRPMVRLKAYKNPRMPEMAPSLARHPDPAVRAAIATAIDFTRWPNCLDLLDALAEDPAPEVSNPAWVIRSEWDDSSGEIPY